jgi:hypothetical protein
MKRNKRTEKVFKQTLTPLTEQILARMGPEGAEIRRRLGRFYQERADPEEPWRYEPPLEN